MLIWVCRRAIVGEGWPSAGEPSSARGRLRRLSIFEEVGLSLEAGPLRTEKNVNRQVNISDAWFDSLLSEDYLSV